MPSARRSKLDLRKLNPPQREAVLHGEGTLLILAGAGSGKTSTMAYRIAHLIVERRVAPSAIVGLSFTNKAARELKDRVLGLIAQLGYGNRRKGSLLSTFHSLCVRIFAGTPKIGYRNQFSIIDSSDQRDILRSILNAFASMTGSLIWTWSFLLGEG